MPHIAACPQHADPCRWAMILAIFYGSRGSRHSRIPSAFHQVHRVVRHCPQHRQRLRLWWRSKSSSLGTALQGIPRLILAPHSITCTKNTHSEC